MRRIYGFILLSGLFLTGVGNAASLTLKSGFFDQAGSNTQTNILSENDGNFCKRGADQRDGCLEMKSQVLLSLNQSKPSVDKFANRMHRGSGRIDTIDYEQDNIRMSSKEDARGSGRRNLTNSEKDSDSAQSTSEEHRGSGRVEA